MQDKSCIFCKIVNGEIPAHKVFEDDDSLAFLDNKPHTKGHTVVISKKHGETVFEFTNDELKELMIDVKKVMALLQEKLSPDGFNVGWNHNTAGGQVVPHLHVHVMPRWNGDGGGSMHSIVNNPSDVEEVAKLFEN
ncbi:HIT family protein [Candidatus Woesearchaeota archaeon]|jgi:histidine triad (HIT) family protein|nr:HIT family protein [Candidatus Woesearchaeota archaeon]MBT4150418.1 HIT family protein [Candidatus Woesearchaeota archaeon]MBT4247507.1 HIT family protein [Candidatus Woesearchaeota archaeon]MBT4434454.1 HIT family protein [Candidatus Woesearchaeota archaeon]MBT7331692.1 HIT family protein [Candidatus Woesearchaeota archaeon]